MGSTILVKASNFHGHFTLHCLAYTYHLQACDTRDATLLV